MPGIIASKGEYLKICPFCGEELAKTVVLKRKLKKTCKCNHCNKTIDERFVVH